ncbi:Kelch motif family protein [Histomonas meleagridis]|uniref:Kelch motif family protein n=1 Tax=Histomonas meleagridis TaxID=135588 RepID=UPI00355A5096|nr:Kelch motif family protein [Histomonas meleagridis]KAH0803996.1 Kelch motif family protein [Histomonas meleagridis]
MGVNESQLKKVDPSFSHANTYANIPLNVRGRGRGNRFPRNSATNRTEYRREAILPQPELLKMSFAATWSIQFPESLAPTPREGHFSTYSEELQKLYIGYGTDSVGTIMNDVWELDLAQQKWRRIILHDPLFPRTNCSASISGDLIYVFGGETNECEYVSQLHSINIKTGEISIADDSLPDYPEPRISPIIQAYNQKIFIWGGSNGSNLSDLSILDLSENHWRTIKIDFQGRSSVPWCLIDHKVYSYGGSKNSSLIIIDLEEESVVQEQCIGSPPPPESSSAGMVRVENSILYFGGKTQTNWSLLYALDLSRSWWYVFHVLPDNETVTVRDGRVNEYGQFMLPRTHHFSIGYSPKDKKVVATLGAPFNEPPTLFVLSIGEALGVLHMRDDMLDELARAHT